ARQRDPPARAAARRSCRLVVWRRVAASAETLGQKRISEGAVNHYGGEPQGLPPALEGYKHLDGPSGGEEKTGEQAENDGLMPALFFLFFQKPGRSHASQATPEPKLGEQTDKLMPGANDVPM